MFFDLPCICTSEEGRHVLADEDDSDTNDRNGERLPVTTHQSDSLVDAFYTEVDDQTETAGGSLSTPGATPTPPQPVPITPLTSLDGRTDSQQNGPLC